MARRWPVVQPRAARRRGGIELRDGAWRARGRLERLWLELSGPTSAGAAGAGAARNAATVGEADLGILLTRYVNDGIIMSI